MNFQLQMKIRFGNYLRSVNHHLKIQRMCLQHHRRHHQAGQTRLNGHLPLPRHLFFQKSKKHQNLGCLSIFTPNMYYRNWSLFQHLPSSAIKSTFTNSHFSHRAVRDIIDQCIRVTGTSSKNTPHKKHLGKVFPIGKIYLKHFISHITNMFDMHTRVKKLFLAFFLYF